MTALAPPDRPVPAPRGTTGTPSSAQVRTTCWTSVSDRARTAAAARPVGAHSASSCDSEASTSGSTTIRSAGSTRPSCLNDLGLNDLGLGRLVGHSTSESSSAVAWAPAGLMIDAA